MVEEGYGILLGMYPPMHLRVRRPVVVVPIALIVRVVPSPQEHLILMIIIVKRMIMIAIKHQVNPVLIYFIVSSH